MGVGRVCTRGSVGTATYKYLPSLFSALGGLLSLFVYLEIHHSYRTAVEGGLSSFDVWHVRRSRSSKLGWWVDGSWAVGGANSARHKRAGRRAGMGHSVEGRYTLNHSLRLGCGSGTRTHRADYIKCYVEILLKYLPLKQLGGQACYTRS